METLAYLHLALADEAPADNDYTDSTPIWKNPKLYSTRTAIPLLSLTIALGILGMAKQASAAVKQGDRGSEVTALQRQLQRLGYLKANATGYFGPLTRQAVMKFQQAKGLPPDGVVGGTTRSSLYKRPKRVVEETPSESWQLGDRGERISEIQKTLAMAGYPSSTNGVFDKETEEAVRLFQQAKGLKVDGIAGEETLTALSGKPGSELKPEPPDERDEQAVEESSEESSKGIWRLGDRSSKVSEIQKSLAAAGFQPGADSIFDEKTEKAVGEFQQAKGLTVDGIVGPETLAALSQKPENVLTPQAQPTPENELTPQAQLKPENELTPQAQLKPENELTPQAQLKPENELTPQAQLKPENELTPQAQPKLENELTPQAQPKSENELTADPKKNIRWYSIEEPTQQLEESSNSVWRLGDRGSKISEIQKGLTAAGFQPGADGVFDEKTEKAVEQFQQTKGLKADGIVGQETLGALSQKPGNKLKPQPKNTTPWYEDESAPLSPFTR
jgi:peptidoglycan hydrolase-like protein with peptidoglycan-binding domain